MPEKEVKPEIHLGLPAFIPEDYISNVHRRLVAYKRLSMAGTDDDLIKIKEELIDCYGSVPLEAENLFDVIYVRNLLASIRGKKMRYDGEKMCIDFHPESPVNASKIVELTRRKGVALSPDFKLTVLMPDLRAREITEQARKLLQSLIY
jgi:transcription-repair coupling factor (superfamily II helicase)